MPPAPALFGTIAPSGNTVVERTTAAMLRGLPGVASLTARVPVHGASDPFPDAHDLDGMLAAARLLAHARPACVVWNGSKGGAIGLAHDRDLCARLSDATGLPADTSALRLARLAGATGRRRVALLTPYARGYQQRLAARLASEGIEVVAERHLGLTDNLSYASVPYATILGLARHLAAEARGRADAVLAWCTNLPAAPLAATVEAETGLPLWDATALGVLAGLEGAGVAERPVGWGSLFDGPAPGALRAT